MKKLLAAVMALTVLAGCSNGGSSNDNTFTVGMECGYAPFNWQTATETETSVSLGGAGYCDGYDVRIARMIADELGRELVVKKIAWTGLEGALSSGEIDAIIAGMTADETRENGNVDFTSPYYESEMVMVVRKDSEEANYTDIQQFGGKTIVGQIATNYDTIIDQINGVNHATPKDSYPLMVLSLQQNEVDGITAELPVALGVVQANPDLAIVHFDEGKGFDIDTTVSIGLKDGSRGSDFFNAVQTALDNIDEETRTEMMLQATEEAPTGE